MAKTVLITGVGGQLGQFLVKKFLSEGVQVIGTVRHKSYDNQPWIFNKKDITIDLMDLNDAHSIENIIIKYKPTYFVNTAANAYVGESWAVPEQHIQQNTLGVLHQLEAIRKHSPNTKYLNLGTSEEFACSEIGGPQNENTKIAPKSPYGCSKAASRYLIDVFRASYGLYALQPWCFNFESELRGEKYLTGKVAKGVARIYHAIKEGKSFEPIELGNLYSSRSWQYAEDVAEGIYRMLNQEEYRDDLRPELYREGKFDKNLTMPLRNYCFSEADTHTIKEFVELSFREAGVNGVWGKPSNDPKDEFFCANIHYDQGNGMGYSEAKKLVIINPKFYRPLDVTFLYGDASAARKELKWESTIKFPELVKRMVKWHVENYKE